MTKNKPNQGAKKTETLTLRLDPKVRFLIDLIARQKRQSITGVIESAVEVYATNFYIEAELWDEATDEDKMQEVSLYKLSKEIFSTDDSFRFMMLVWSCPRLLSYEEVRLKETIYASELFWDEYPNADSSRSDIDTDVLREHWVALLAHVDEHKSSPTVVPYLAR
jgi:predicted transcriptional regulator